jgi:hypothetical protein
MPPVPVFGKKTQRYRSIILHRENYEELAVISKIEGRYITGQLRIIIDTWKRQNLSKNDLAFLASELAALRAERDQKEAQEEEAERRLRKLEEDGIIPPRPKPVPKPGRPRKRKDPLDVEYPNG